MARDPDPITKMWELIHAGSAELAEEIGIETDVEAFVPADLSALDNWLLEQGPLDEEEVARLGFFLARVLIDTYGGGLTQIKSPGHPLDGEWAVTDFTSYLPDDFHVPFLISAARIGLDRALSAAEWHRQLVQEAE